jgi:hypothetical protein
MSRLSEISTNRTISAIRVCLYSQPGWGKTYLASKLPDCIFILSEDGLAELSPPHFPVRTDWKNILEDLKSLINEEHNYKNVVFDHLGNMEKLLCDSIAKSAGVSNVAEIPYGKGIAEAQTQFRNFLRGCDILRSEKNINVIPNSDKKHINFPIVLE